MKLTSDVESINEKEDLADFLSDLRREWESNSSFWENKDLGRYLEAMESWIRSIDSYSTNSGDADVRNPSWRTFAKILIAARIYE